MVSRLLHKKNILKLKKTSVVVLGSFGHSGIDWLHSLIDGHKGVLILPAFSYFRTIDRLKIRYQIDILKISNLKKISEIITNLFFKDKAYRVKRRKFIFTYQQKKKFQKTLNFYLQNDNDTLVKRIFFGIHYAYLKLYNIKNDNIKCIVIHEHVAWHCYKYNSIFNTKFLFIFRDPRAALGGGILKMKNSNVEKKINSFQFDTLFLHMISALKFIVNRQNKNKCLVLFNEKMHLNLTKEMKKLCIWLKISFSANLLKQTFLKKKWKGESAYLAKDELKKEPSKDFYLPTNVEKRWRSVLKNKDILMIEVLFEKQILLHKYKFYNQLNFVKRLNGYFYFLFGYLWQPKYFFLKYLVITRNILRRFLILINFRVFRLFFQFH